MRISGIYCITNNVNGKKYVGKSIDIKKRWIAHKCFLKANNLSKKHCNRYLYNAVKKYGIENFEFEILECFCNNWCEDYAKEREFFWIEFLNTCNHSFGYNLRKDSSTKMIVHDKTKKLISQINKGSNNPNYGNYWGTDAKKKMSKLAKDRHQNTNIYNQEWKNKIKNSCKDTWKDLDKKQKMAEKVSNSLSRYFFQQFTQDNILVKEYSSMKSIIQENPHFKKQCIYAVCDGYKKTYKNHIWHKILKI